MGRETQVGLRHLGLSHLLGDAFRLLSRNT